MTEIRATLADLRPQPGADHQVWAARITACWRASVEAILEVGRLLAAAKEALPHGKFGAMVESELPFSASTAQRLMAIAGDARLSNPAHVQHLPPSWGTLYELTKLPDDEFERKIADGTIRPDMMRRDLAPPVAPIAESAEPQHEISLAREATVIDHDPDEKPAGEPSPPLAEEMPPQSAHNAQRIEDADSLDYSPTPPWATRALFEHLLPHLGVTDIASAWEPACGEGHMTAVMEEYVRGPVIGTDIHDYSRDGRSPPGWFRTLDFLDIGEETPVADWIVTNPPFGSRVLPFMDRALDLAQVGVAMFLQLRFLEGVDRYEMVYRDRPPTLVAPFVERVPLHMGRYEPDGSTMTAFMWLVWMKGKAPRPPFWIPQGSRIALRRDGDDERFTAHPVIGTPRTADNVISITSPQSIPPDVGVGTVDEPFDPETGELSPESTEEAAENASARHAESEQPSREAGSATPAPPPFSAASNETPAENSSSAPPAGASNQVADPGSARPPSQEVHGGARANEGASHETLAARPRDTEIKGGTGEGETPVDPVSASDDDPLAIPAFLRRTE